MENNAEAPSSLGFQMLPRDAWTNNSEFGVIRGLRTCLANLDGKEAPQSVRGMENVSWNGHLEDSLGSGVSCGVVLAINLGDMAPLSLLSTSFEKAALVAGTCLSFPTTFQDLQTS